MKKVVHINGNKPSIAEQLDALRHIDGFSIDLRVNVVLNDEDLRQFAAFIESNRDLSFHQLSLRVKTKSFNSRYSKILELLNESSISNVDLIFSEEELGSVSNAIETSLTKNIAPKVSYPLHIFKSTEEGILPSGLDLAEFERTIIANIQERNKHGLQASVDTQKRKRDLDPNDPLAKKIRLKEIIRNQQHQDASTANYMAVEVQYVETVEYQVAQEEVIEVRREFHEIQEYGGELIGYDDFDAPLYKKKVSEQTNDEALTDSLYALLRQELFANLPHGIKYISPNAAHYLAENLPALVTLNKDNLPHGFILKQTDAGELVLDFDEFLENEQTNPFTPKVPNIDAKPIYDISISRQNLRECGVKLGLLTILCPNQSQSVPKQLNNLWIKYGDEGVTKFFEQLSESVGDNIKLHNLLLKNYLLHLPQWDHLHNNQLFFNCISTISRYDDEKLACLEKFLKNTGSSWHDLPQTITAFERFWTELSILCAEQNVSIAGINQSNWSTPVGGNPVVYMERLLSILKNARSLEDQFVLLEDITLSNYGAYYASEYEGFKAVSTKMELKYDPEEQDQQPFNKDSSLYRVELSELVEQYKAIQDYTFYKRYGSRSEKLGLYLIDHSKELPETLDLEQLNAAGLAIPYSKEAFKPPYQLYTYYKEEGLTWLMAEMPKVGSYAGAFRFLGLQETGITVSAFSEEFRNFEKDFFSYYDISAELLSSIFFVSHERYMSDEPLNPIFETLHHTACHKHVIADAMEMLATLYKLDIKLNQREGMTLFSSISGMNSAEFEGLGIDKGECIKKLLLQLQYNKFATFKFFKFRSEKCNPKWPFLYALDTAEVLSQDPIVAATYHDDLLLFAGMINSIRKEVYYHARYENPQPKDEEKAKQIKANLQKVKEYLHLAATQEQPNNFQYAVQVMLNSREFFTYKKFLDACADIQLLAGFNSKEVDTILAKHKFTVNAKLPELFAKDNADLKGIMIALILRLLETKHARDNVDVEDGSGEQEGFDPIKLGMELAALSISELQIRLESEWKEAGALLTIANKLFVRKILKMARDLSIKSAFNQPDAEGLLKVVSEKISELPDFQDCSDFEKVNLIVAGVQNIAGLLRQILRNPYVKEHENEFVDAFSRIDFRKIDYEILFSVLDLLTAMPQRNYLPLLNSIFSDVGFVGKKEYVLELIGLLASLNNSYFPAEYLNAFCQFVIKNSGEKEFAIIKNNLISIYDNDNNDPILEFIMTSSALGYTQVFDMLVVSSGINTNRDKISLFFACLEKNGQLDNVLKQLGDPDSSGMLLEILARGHALSEEGKVVSYNDLTLLLNHLDKEEIEQLHEFCLATPVSAECLLNALRQRQPSEHDDFAQFLLAFEKAPFGERDIESQFSTSEVERVVNQSTDLLNHSAYSYQHRKQLMEAFLFVNEIGKGLPVYYGKPAKDLTNAEIKDFFADIKAKKITNLTPFQTQLLALGLVREAMYRSSGEFPYSTQMLALIDGMMHQADFISNIDTGQGKSLIDTMKLVFLWLVSDRVDLTTSSLVDARRDIAHYGPLLFVLGVPYSKTPISSTSEMEDFSKEGINFSTSAQMSLFFAKAKVLNVELEKPDAVVSLVANESDHTILDDRVIYRFASADGSGIGYGQEWIYYAINEFVTAKEFVLNDKATIADDIRNLKQYLKAKAAEQKKSAKIVDKFSHDQYLTWLESALMVNFVLKENEDYVIPDAFEKRVINGSEVRTKVVKILMKDGKVSPDSTFGNGMQQLLYARLNAERGCEDFIIEPQNKTIISTNNRNLIDYYRSRNGFIWGSSGSVGSGKEVEEQYRKYGFEFSKTEPHQETKVVSKKPIIEKDEAAQFEKLTKLLTAESLTESTAPSVVFCKNINTAIRLFNQFKENNPENFPVQLYTGLGKEEDIIRRAGQPGMITITTSALGRNTDIHYDRVQGLCVWHTFVDSTRRDHQKSGRTGRQGSAGEVHYVLNKQDLGDKSIEAIQSEIDQKATIDRSINEELYNVLGRLLAKADKFDDDQFKKGKAAFFRDNWSEFSAAMESHYREMRRNAEYSQVEFIDYAVNVFNQMMKEVIHSDVEIDPRELSDEINYEHKLKESYKVSGGAVKISDCTPPITIAYHMLGFSEPEEESTITKDDVKTQLATTFSKLSVGEIVDANREYLEYLHQNTVTRSMIVDAHKEFLSEFIAAPAKKPNFFQRLFGIQSQLSNIVKNEHYLVMFKAFASISEDSAVELDVLKKAVNHLLDDYLQKSWFVNKERKAWVGDMKEVVDSATSVKELVEGLSAEQTNVAGSDIESNKKRAKRLHLFGRSRYQETLSRAIGLAASLNKGDNSIVSSLKNDLLPLMQEATDNQPIDVLTEDALKAKVKAKKVADRPNASVIAKALESTLRLTADSEPKGMIGRKNFFSEQVREINDHEEFKEISLE